MDSTFLATGKIKLISVFILLSFLLVLFYLALHLKHVSVTLVKIQSNLKTPEGGGQFKNKSQSNRGILIVFPAAEKKHEKCFEMVITFSLKLTP